MSSTLSNINNTFFDSSYKHAWRRIIPDGLTQAEADFIQEMGALQHGGRLLDLMCGYGRHAMELAKRNVEVTAVDNLPDYINEISNTAATRHLPIHPVLGDALTVSLEKIYDAAICMGNSFAFFNREEAIGILKKLNRHLKPGGIFIINSWMIAEIAIRYFKEKDWHHAGDYKCVLENKYLFHPSRIECEQTIIAPDGSVEILKGVDYIFTLDELEAMFAETGFQTKFLFSTPRKRKFSIGDAQIYIVAEKIP